MRVLSSNFRNKRTGQESLSLSVFFFFLVMEWYCENNGFISIPNSSVPGQYNQLLSQFNTQSQQNESQKHQEWGCSSEGWDLVVQELTAELQKLRWFSFSVDWDLGGLSQLAIAEVLCKLWNKIWFWVHRSNFIIAQRNLHGNTPQGNAIFVIWVLCVV